MGKLKLMTIIGTRPEIIRLSATIKCCDRYFEQILVHTGQNYDYTLNQVFFDDLGLRAPDYYLDAVGDDLGAIFPQLRKVDFIIGGAVGLARSIIGICVIFMLMPIILTVLPFDAIEQLVSSSAIASFFYQSNILLKLIPGV